MPTTDGLLAPGARILVREEEWLVTRVDATRTGGKAISAVGLSELVHDQEAVFLTELHAKGEIVTLRPEETCFVADESPRYLRSRLYLEGRLRKLPPSGEPGQPALMIGHRANMDVLDYQLKPALLALEQPRPRILIADAVGLGKTLEAGILLSELIARGRGKRILVCTVKSMLAQFQAELLNRFAIPLVRLDSEGIALLRQKIPANANPFHYHDKTIISLDTLKQDRAYRHYLETAYWDVIVIDEAHHVAERGSGSQRNALAERLAKRSDALILLSATPHDGRPRSFASLMRMLDPTAIADPDDYTQDDIQGLYVRRFKQDVEAEIAKAFQPRTFAVVKAQATPAEEAAFHALAEVPTMGLAKRKTGQLLFKTVLEKALFSSPQACLATVRQRLKKAVDSREAEALEELARRLEAIRPGDFSKFQRLLTLLDAEGWKGQDPEDRLVIFTERLETLRFLEKYLPAALGLTTDQVVSMDGGMRDKDLMQKVSDFGQRNKPVRLLLATDVAAEGLNLHHLCHRLIHFDVPWSLMLFQQRNGRVDRYGQKKAPRLHYLMTESNDEKIRGDLRVLDILIKKDAQVQKNLGDPAVLMGVYDVDAEVALTGQAIEEGREDFLADTPDHDAFWDLFTEPVAAATPVPAEARPRRQAPLSLWNSDYAYLKAACECLYQSRGLEYRADDANRTLTFHPPEDLAFRLKRGPAESDPGPDPLRLSADQSALERAIAEARARGTQPELQFLWALHPAMGWLDDKLAGDFGRDSRGRQLAPVLRRAQGLEPGEVAYAVVGILPNRKGHPVIQSWLGIRVKPNGVPRVESFERLAEALALGADDWVNPGTPLSPPLQSRLEKALPHVLQAAGDAIRERRAAFHATMDPRAQDHLARLAELRAKQEAKVQLRLAGLQIPETRKQREKEREFRAIQEHFDAYEAWILDTLTTESTPYLQVMAAFVAPDEN